MYQKLTIAGNLGGDPELREVGGKEVCNFSVATNRKWKGADGQVQDETVWFKVAVWGKQAQACHKYLKKGRQVLCDGRLTVDKETGQPRVWQDKNGNWRASYEMAANEVRFLSGNAPSTGKSKLAASEDEIPF